MPGLTKVTRAGRSVALQKPDVAFAKAKELGYEGHVIGSKVSAVELEQIKKLVASGVYSL